MPKTPRSPLLYDLIHSGKRYIVPKGEVIMSLDEPLGVVMMVKGYIKRYSITNEGSLGVQIIYGPEDVFSLTQVYNSLLKQSLYDGPETYHYQAMCEAHFYALNITAFKNAVLANQDFYKELFSEAGRHLKTSVHLIENISLPNAYQRVAHQLVFWSRNFGRPVNIGVCIQIPLTHQDIADKLGLTRETVSQSIVQLRKASLIKTGRNIVVPSVKKLEVEAYK